MIEQYIEAVSGGFGGVLDLLTRLALPLAVLALGAAVLAALGLAFQRDGSWLQRADWHGWAGRAGGCVVVGLLAVAGWTALRTTHSLARQDVTWRETAEATANPVPDAPAVYQYGPSVAALAERTYTRTLNLPPEFLRRVGTEGIGVLAPYLSDPSAEGVLRLVDNFRRSGRDVVFTRQVTRLDEAPIPFSDSQVRVSFRQLPGRAFDMEFEGRYTFANAGAAPVTTRFRYALPQAGTVRDLSVSVGGQSVTEPDDSGVYQWTGPLAPGEGREAVVRCRILGTRSWHYDIGSRRRRVQRFRLEAATGGRVRFMRGSLQPTASAGATTRWELSNVVTAQQVALSFPPDVARRESYLQALSALPAAFALFLVGAMGVGWGFHQARGPGPLVLALAVFGIGLAASAVIANYMGPVTGVLVGPLAGAAMAGAVLGRHSLLAAVPAALVPAAFLSPDHSGLLLLILAILAASASGVVRRR